MNRHDQVTDLDRGQRGCDTQSPRAPVELNNGDHLPRDAQSPFVADAPAKGAAIPKVHAPGQSSNGGSLGLSDAQVPDAPTNGRGHIASDALSGSAPAVHLLTVVSGGLDEIEKVRIAMANQLQALLEFKGLSKFDKAVVELEALLEVVTDAEDLAELNLKRVVRQHPLGGWVKETMGVGEKQGARLLAAIGDPLRYDERDDQRQFTGRVVNRTVSKLWAYCGYKPGQGKKVGQDHAYNWTAKMRAFLIAESAENHRCKACTAAGKKRPKDAAGWIAPPRKCSCAEEFPLRAIYDHERLKWADRDTSDAHKRAHALRVVAKKGVLMSLYNYARDLERGQSASDVHGPRAALNLEGGHIRSDTQGSSAPLDLDGGRECPDAQDPRATVDLEGGHPGDDTHGGLAPLDLGSGQGSGDTQSSPAAPNKCRVTKPVAVPRRASSPASSKSSKS